MAKPKKGGKGKKGKGSADAGGAPGVAKGDELDELSRQFYLLQIRDLEEKLARYQEKCDVLTLENTEYHEKHHNEQQDKQEIVSYLRKITEEKSDKIHTLNEEILTLQAKADQEREESMKKYTSLKNDAQEAKDRLKAENALLNGQLSSLQDFKVRKDELENEYSDLQNTLEKIKNQHQETLYALERKQVVDKDRLKKEMIHRVNAVATEFRRVSNQQMAETTKRTIQENVAVNSQLIKLTDKTKDLMAENESLRSKLSTQSQRLEMLEKTEHELARKNHCSARLICLVTERSTEMETDLNVTEEVLQETRIRVQDLENDEDSRRQLAMTFNDLLEKYNKIVEEYDELKLSHSDLEKLVAKLQKVVDQCSIDLTNHLMGHNENVLPNLLSLLASASTGTVKKTVEVLLGPGTHHSLTYQNGSLGMVPK